MVSTPEELRAAERLRQQLKRQRVTPDQAALLERYAETWPTMTAQAAVGLALQGLDPESDQARKIAEAEGLELLSETRDHRGFWSRALDVAGTAIGTTGEGLSSAVKATSRVGYTLYDSVQQEFVKEPLRALAYASDQASDQGGFDVGEFFGSFDEGQRLAGRGRNEGRLLQNQFSRNPLATAKSLITGGEDTLGSGFLPGGEIGAEAEAQRSQIQIGGGGADFGDLVASTWLEPDSREHEMWSGMLQMGFDIGSDPGGAVTATATKVKKAGQLLGETKNIGFGWHVGNRVDDSGALGLGLVRGEQNTILPEVVSAYTRSDEFAPIANKLLDQNVSNYDLFQAFRGKLDPEQLAFLRQSANREELATKVDRLLGGGQGADSTLAPAKIKLRAPSEPSRWASLLPSDSINLNLGRRDAATQLDRALIAGKVDRAERARILDLWAEAPQLKGPQGRAAAKSIVQEGYKAIENTLVAKGVDPEHAKTLTRIYDRVEDDTKYILDTLTDDPLTVQARSRIMVDGEPQDIGPALRLVSELVQEIPLPNIRQISVEMTDGAMNSKLFKTPYQAELALSQWVNKAWVPAQLMRLAWTTRVIGEEQLRMAVSGMDSAFRHPISAIAWAVGRKGSDDVTGSTFKATDEAGEAVDVFHEAAMARKFDSWGYKTDAGKVASGQYQLTRRGEAGHWNNVVHNLRSLHDDAVSRRVAAGESTDDIVSHLMSDAGKPMLDDIASQFDPKVAERFVNDPGALRAYIDGFVRRGVHQTTGGNEALLKLVADGSVDGASFRAARTGGPLSGRAKTDLARKVRAALGDDNAPEVAAGPKMVDAKTTQRWDQLVDFGMSWLMGKPTNWLSRSPTFRQSYWDRSRQLIGGATKEVQDEIIRNAAETFGARSKEMKALVKAAQSGSGELITDIRQLDNAAKAHALEFTKDLLYDQARKTQWVEMTRGIFVFAEAWKEIATTWGKMVANQPNLLRRAGQGIKGLRDAGVFYTDPQSGQEMFTYPAGGWVAKVIGGANTMLPGDQFGQLPGVTDPERGEVGVRMTAPVESLNLLAGSVLPGVGPVVSVAAAQLIPDIPEADWLKDVLFPFGSEEEEGTPGQVAESMLPSYMQKLWQGWRDGKIDRSQYANARFDVMRALAIHDPERYTGPGSDKRLWEDSEGIANNVFAIRGATSFFGAPAAPRVEYFTVDMNGQAFNFAALTKAYWDIFKNEAGGDHAEATREFIDRFGVSPDLLRQGKTQSINKRAATEPGAEWERENPDLVAEHREVIGYYAPEDTDEDALMDGQAFDRAIAAGDRENLTPDIMLKLANQRTGYLAYDAMVSRFEAEGTTLSSAQKKELKAIIGQQYPGFGETIPTKKRAKPTEVIENQLKPAQQNPKLAATPQGKALAIYLDARDKFLEAAADQYGVSTLTGKKVRGYRQALVELGSLLVNEYDGFSSVWDEVLSHEIKADELEDESDG